MMTKIFGALLIVSGGYAMGRVACLNKKNRLTALKELDRLFQLFGNALREYRSTLEETFRQEGEIAQQILSGDLVKGLSQQDIQYLESTVSQLKMGTYRESVEANDAFLNYLGSAIKCLEEDAATTGKALPLVTGAVGLLVAVLLL